MKEAKTSRNEEKTSDFCATLVQGIEAAFAGALEQIADNVVDILNAQLTANAKDDDANQSTTLTLQPKVRIDFTSPAAVVLTVTIPAKKINKVTGESSYAFDLNQPDLPMN